MRKELARLFPAIKKKINGKELVYLDSACTALKNSVSAEIQEKSLLEEGFCAGARSFNDASILAQERFLLSRKKIACSINAKEREIVFVSGATEAANMVAASFPFKAGDEIFLSALEHNSVFLPFWKAAKEKKLKIRIVPLRNYKADLNHFRRQAGKKARMLCLTMSSNLTGGAEDFAGFVSFCRQKGIKVFLDAAQYISSHGLDFGKTGADFAVFSGHKISAPFGTGVLAVREDNFKLLRSSKLGGGTIVKIVKDGGLYKPCLLDNNASFEAGIQNYSGARALAETFSILEETGYKKIRTHIAGLCKTAYEVLSSIDGIKIIGGGHEQGSLLSFVFEGKLSAADFQLYARDACKASLAFRTGKMCADLACLNLGIDGAVRISFGFYNEKRDIEIFAQTLKDFLRES